MFQRLHPGWYDQASRTGDDTEHKQECISPRSSTQHQTRLSKTTNLVYVFTLVKICVTMSVAHVQNMRCRHFYVAHNTSESLNNRPFRLFHLQKVVPHPRK